ncbi:MAG: hypothetical protein V4773_25370 [Verrucomicrobiota bacterium]
MLESTFMAADEISHAHERHLEKANLLDALSIPHLSIPGDEKALGETYIDIMFELGPESEQGDINVAET